MTTLNQLTKKYRKLCAQPKQWDRKLEKAKAHMRTLQDAKHKCLMNIENTKLLIDYCVITGECPTQAQLSHTVNQMQDIVQYHARIMSTEYSHMAATSVAHLNQSLSNIMLSGSTLTSTFVPPVNPCAGSAATGTILNPTITTV
jgi:hypothetical protein